MIYAADVKPWIHTFGFSISGGNDMDKNVYPDILVGAYKSNKAVLLRYHLTPVRGNQGAGRMALAA